MRERARIDRRASGLLPFAVSYWSTYALSDQYCESCVSRGRRKDQGEYKLEVSHGQCNTTQYYSIC
jgi:hypothetical protein